MSLFAYWQERNPISLQNTEKVQYSDFAVSKQLQIRFVLYRCFVVYKTLLWNIYISLVIIRCILLTIIISDIVNQSYLSLLYKTSKQADYWAITITDNKMDG